MAHKVRTLRLPIAPPPKAPVRPKAEPMPGMPSGGKDYSDILIVVLDAGERIYHLDHRHNYKGSKLNGSTYELNGRKYILNLDRAYRIRWAPWKKLIVGKPYLKNISRFFNELTRSKKIGLLLYQEPCTNKCSTCKDEGGEKCKLIPTEIDPMHISRIHQPSGRMIGEDHQVTKGKEVALDDWLSPHGFKMIVDSSPKYKKAFKSYAFGLIHKIKAKWVWVMVGGIVVLVIILYITGAIKF